MKGICEVEVPPDFEPSAGQLVACYLYDPSIEQLRSEASRA